MNGPVLTALAVFATVGSAQLPSTDGRVISSKTFKPTVNQPVLLVVITSRTIRDGHPLGGSIIVEKRIDGKLRPIWRQENLNPWKLETADLDGDDRREVVVGVWKKSPKDQVMARRAFVYAWNGSRLVPKWLGSRLGRRFIDFGVVDINRDGWDELIALELAPCGRHRVSVYRWKSFGFEWLGATREQTGLSKIETVGRYVFVMGHAGKLRLLGEKGRYYLK